ncbi:MAG: hypothetical protein H6662_14785 [Ardenticatenaceae bacterium]|nr:hypothetical protein [Ardenticatenaceae bacterium]MCB9005430.1 hypothetical protein [Ardenticatenaceae bacterium]
MKKHYWMSGIALLVLLSVFGFMMSRSANSVFSQPLASSDNDELLPVLDSGEQVSVLAPTADSRLVYFSPQDNPATATVITLYNSGDITQTIPVQGINSNGEVIMDVSVELGAHDMVHLVSDDVAASPPPSWADAILANFTDSSTYGVMAVPQDVKLDGYVLFNGGTGTVDPYQDQGAIPLRFSADPLTVFLPLTES